MTRLLIFVLVCFSSSSFADEVNKERFIHMVDFEIWQSGYSRNMVEDHFDCYMYYYLNGKICGLMEARRIFELCEERKPL